MGPCCPFSAFRNVSHVGSCGVFCCSLTADPATTCCGIAVSFPLISEFPSSPPFGVARNEGSPINDDLGFPFSCVFPSFQARTADTPSVRLDRILLPTFFIQTVLAAAKLTPGPTRRRFLFAAAYAPHVVIPASSLFFLFQVPLFLHPIGSQIRIPADHPFERSKDLRRIAIPGHYELKPHCSPAFTLLLFC